MILLFSTQCKVTLRSNQTQHHHSTTMTQSNLDERQMDIIEGMDPEAKRVKVEEKSEFHYNGEIRNS